MPRRREVAKRTILPDPKFSDVLVAKFINILMKQGKRSLAERIFYNALDIIGEKVAGDGVKVFRKAVDNVKPVLEVRPRRVGGATYQIPVEIRPQRRTALSIRWIVQSARVRHEKTMDERLAAELLDASNNAGTSIKKKEDTHKMAEANKAFAHYKW